MLHERAAGGGAQVEQGRLDLDRGVGQRHPGGDNLVGLQRRSAPGAVAHQAPGIDGDPHLVAGADP